MKITTKDIADAVTASARKDLRAKMAKWSKEPICIALGDVHTLGDTEFIGQTPANDDGIYTMTIKDKNGILYEVEMNLFQGLNL